VLDVLSHLMDILAPTLRPVSLLSVAACWSGPVALGRGASVLPVGLVYTARDAPLLLSFRSMTVSCRVLFVDLSGNGSWLLGLGFCPSLSFTPMRTRSERSCFMFHPPPPESAGARSLPRPCRRPLVVRPNFRAAVGVLDAVRRPGPVRRGGGGGGPGVRARARHRSGGFFISLVGLSRRFGRRGDCSSVGVCCALVSPWVEAFGTSAGCRVSPRDCSGRAVWSVERASRRGGRVWEKREVQGNHLLPPSELQPASFLCRPSSSDVSSLTSLSHVSATPLPCHRT